MYVCMYVCAGGQAVFQTSLGCLKLRDDISRDEIEIFEEQLRPGE
jgi:hypothetical protein